VRQDCPHTLYIFNDSTPENVVAPPEPRLHRFNTTFISSLPNTDFHSAKSFMSCGDRSDCAKWSGRPDRKLLLRKFYNNQKHYPFVCMNSWQPFKHHRAWSERFRSGNPNWLQFPLQEAWRLSDIRRRDADAVHNTGFGEWYVGRPADLQVDSA
jgi:hypothetical protein